MSEDWEDLKAILDEKLQIEEYRPIRESHDNTYFVQLSDGTKAIIKDTNEYTNDLKAVMNVLHDPRMTQLMDERFNYKRFMGFTYQEGISLSDYLTKEEGNQGQPDVIRGMVRSIRHMVENNVVHCDLKPANAIVGKQSVSWIDFECAQLLREEHKQIYGIFGGTPLYVPKELLLRAKVSHKSDIQSFGRILFEIVTGMPMLREMGNVETLFFLMNSDPIDLVPKGSITRSGWKHGNLERMETLVRSTQEYDHKSMDANRPTIYEVEQELIKIL